MAGFDNNYYQNHLDSLFNETGVYNVDPFLFGLRDKNRANQVINNEQYFKEISNITFKSDKKDEVLARMQEDPSTYNLLKAHPVSESVEQGEFKRLSGSADNEFASINIIMSSQTVLSPQAILHSIQRNNGNRSDAQLQALQKSHNDMHVYMRSILQSTGKVHFSKILELIRQDQDLLKDSDPWVESRYLFTFLSQTRIDSLIETLSDTTSRILCMYVRDKVRKNMSANSQSTTQQEQKQFLRTTLLDDLQIGNFKGPLYYTLRTELAKRVRLSSKVLNAENENTIMYFKQLAADAYIKTCYPVIIYDYIHCMMNMYIRYGDFVNSRIALLAKIMFVYYFYFNITSLYKSNSSSISQKSNVAFGSMMSSTLTSLQFYIQNINNIDMEYANTNMMTSIVKDLHQTSNTVVDKNKEVQKVKKEIRMNQLAMRNIIYNSEELNKQYKSKVVENIILIVILLTIMIVCSILLILQNEKNRFKVYVMYASGGVAFAILIYLLTKMLIKIAKNSKKS